MASKQQNRATTYLCPLDCGYDADSPGSVEGHVSAMQDDTHSGHWGSEYRDEIESGSVVTDTDAPSIDPPDDSDGGSGGDSDPSTPIDYEGRLGEDDSDDSAHMPGLPITPVATTAIVLAVIVIVLYLVRSRSDSETTPAQQQEEGGDEFDPDAALEAMSERNTRPGGVT